MFVAVVAVVVAVAVVAAVAEVEAVEAVEAVAEGNHPQSKSPPHSTLSEAGALTIKSVLL